MKHLRQLLNYMKMIFKFNFSIAFWSVLAKISHRKNFLGIYFTNKKHKSIKKFLYKRYGYILDKEKSFQNKNIEEKCKVWIFWWQGIENAPPIVKMCINSIRCNFKNHELVIITNENYDKYVEIPKYLIDRLEAKQINIANFADVYRTLLLSNYGGIWLDATIYMACEFSKEIYNYPFISAKRKINNASLLFPAESRWGTYFLAIGSDNELMYYVSQILLAYWQDFDYSVDYGLIDYVICVCMEKKKNVYKMIDKSPYYCEKIHDLQPILNNDFDKYKYKKLIKDNPFFKLTYKISFEEYNNNKRTFYGYLMNKSFEEMKTWTKKEE